MTEQTTQHRGYIQIYTGNGKGKTSAALGLATRAAGHQIKTYIGQFMKGSDYGELETLKGHPFITIEQYGSPHCIRKEEVTKDHIELAQAGLEKARQAMHSGQYHIVVLDEVNVSLWFGLLDTAQVMSFLDEKPDDVKLVLTGRYAPQVLIDRADLVTEMREVKHYYQQGVMARKGIEM